jgi:hypothetical protein
MLVGFLGLLIAMTWAFRETPTGQTLHHYLVEILVKKVSKISTSHLIFLTVGLILLPSFAMVVSADIAVLAAWDFALYYEIVITAWTIASVTKVKALYGHWKLGFLRLTGRRHKAKSQTSRARRVRKPTQPSNDNDDHHARMIIAA